MDNWKGEYPVSCICKRKTKPNKGLVDFVHFLKKRSVTKGKALDVGCGYGAESLYLAKLGFEVVGIDINKESIESANKRSYNKKNIKFIHGDALKIERWLKPNSFDIIIDSAFLHSLKNHQRKNHMKNICKILRKNGWMFLFDFSSTDRYCRLHCPKRRWTFRRIPGKGPRFYVHFSTKEEIKSLLNDLNIMKWMLAKEQPSNDLLLQGIKFREFHAVYAKKASQPITPN